jgi:uncharacterized protein GlcG (DUF336 family)
VSVPTTRGVVEITYASALKLIALVFAEAGTRQINLACSVVDRGGNFVATARMDDAQLGALSLAGDKAFTAASFGQPTSAWAQTSTPGSGDWGLAHTIGGRVVVFPGGIPLYSDGQLIGAMGVSGTVSLVDEQCAVLAAEALGFRVSA